MPTLRILHLSDTHLFGDDSRHYDVVDTADHLRRALEHVATQEWNLVVCSGDVSEDGSAASYARARDALVPWAEARGARVIFAMGNHDQRAKFRAVLGDGQPGAVEVGLATAYTVDPTPITSVATTDGWRTIVLDTSVPQAGYGALDAEQLEFLADALATPAAHGTVIVMHHPPIAAQTDLLQALALGDDDAARFWEIVEGSDVRAVLSGHYHVPIVEFVRGIPVIVAPGVANIARAFESREEESASDGFGGASIEIDAERVRVVTFERPVSDEEVFRFHEEIVRKIIESAGRPTEHTE